MSGSPFVSIRTVGSMLPADLLGRLVEGNDVPALGSQEYHLAPGETVRQAASRSWDYLRRAWTAFDGQRQRMPSSALGAKVTRDRWSLLLLKELGFGQVPVTGAGGITPEGRSFPVSHAWHHVPIHLLGWGVDLDRRTPGLAGAAGAAPQSMVQELLNRSDDHLWALLSNGQRLRLLRDSTSLVGSAYVEFDLEAMFDGELFSDFVVLYLLCHQSRFEAQDAEVGPPSCWLEKWRTLAAEQGTRALEQLRGGVEQAIALLGTGLLRHPDNDVLRERLAKGEELSLQDLQRALLRLIYRLLFWFVAEDRDVLLSPDADRRARDRYTRFFSSSRLRQVSYKRRGGRHGDLWEAARLVLDGLGREGGRPELGLPGLGGLFDPGPLDDPITGTPPDENGKPSREPDFPAASLSNEALLAAVRSLSVVHDRRGGLPRVVDFRNLGAEELGSVYESLLEMHPRHDTETHAFSLGAAAGSERKTTGSYYTPSSLVNTLLDTALNPLLDEASASDDPVRALLDLTVCDPACGSGHFLVAAARRIAKRVAAIESDDSEPSEPAVREAMRRVVPRCIYGVDVNPTAAELAKVSLWMEALDPGRPLSVLDANIRVGNSLFGVTPRLLAAGVPDAAFKPLTGDNWVALALGRRNREERAKLKSGQMDMYQQPELPVGNLRLGKTLLAERDREVVSLSDVHAQAQRLSVLEDSQERRRKTLLADAWCAAFVHPKTEETMAYAVTAKALMDEAAMPGSMPAETRHLVERARRQYRFFHWHLEFPQIFRVPQGDETVEGVDERIGWAGGFSCMVGNPPWERVKLQEQEFFAARDETIALAPNAAARKKLIRSLTDSDPDLYREFQAALRHADGASHMLRSSGRYPLTGRGDINTYAVFAETYRTLLHPTGRLGIVLPTGIATDATTAPFFSELVRTKRLASFLEFENEAFLLSRAVDHRVRFCLLTVVGEGSHVDEAVFAFGTRYIEDLQARTFLMPPDEILLVNPNTGTLPVFRSRRDAEITLGIYRRVPVLIREGDPDGNPWGISFMAMFHMANDSGLFRMRDRLEQEGWSLEGSIFTKGAARMLPLYEAKMLHHFDHRLGTYEGQTQAQKNMGTLPRVTPEQHDDPSYVTIPRYWVSDEAVAGQLEDRWNHNWLLGWRETCRSSDTRTLISSALPISAVGNKFLLALTELGGHLLQANLSSLVTDYVTRQKLSGASLNYFTFKQLPILPPQSYQGAVPWYASGPLGEWVCVRVMELAYTSWDMAGFATDAGEKGPPFRWDEERRAMLRAELDAAYFHLYGVNREDASHILDTFPAVRQNDERAHGEYRTKRLILGIYDAMAKAIETGEAYQSVLEPPPGKGPRHRSTGGGDVS